jgi:hypothetical protein
MRKMGLIIGICLLTSIPALAQVDTAWVRTFGNTQAYGKNIAVDATGNVYVNGYMQNTYASAMVAYDSSGNTLWSRSFDGFHAYDSHGLDMGLNDLGDLYLAGPTFFDNLSSINLIRCSTQGDSIWARTYDGPINHSATPWALATDSVGNVYVAGNSDGPSWATLKYNRDGDMLWANIYTGYPDLTLEDVQKIELDGEGNIIVLGVTRNRFDELVHNATTIKYNGDGVPQWTATYDSVSYFNYGALDLAVDAVDHEGNILVSALSQRSDEAFLKPVIIKYYPDGDTAWIRTYVEADNLEGLDYFIAVDSVGSAYLTGPTYVVDSLNYDFLVVKYTPDGNISWAGTYDSGYDDLPTDIAVGHSGAIYIGGICDRGGNDYHINIVKYTANGDRAWVTGYNSANALGDWIRDMTLDEQENIYIAGQSNGHLITIKFVQTETGVEDNESPNLPENDLLLAAYPNPFNARTIIRYELTAPSNVALTVFDLLGNKIETLVNGYQDAGRYKVDWDASDFPSGIYFYHLSAGEYSSAKKVLLIK